MFEEATKLNNLPTDVDMLLFERVVMLHRHLSRAIRVAIELIVHSNRSLGFGSVLVIGSGEREICDGLFTFHSSFPLIRMAPLFTVLPHFPLSFLTLKYQ